ncbi:unnamed protein product [Adineta steineri]|uniref:Uncharacterized protein n=1 Tax=Adineta steineri TaxID=433720 RepID=A0A814AZU2_9BILA|nr:unnamed protein product [Adineta steineri]CAF4033688.1 unnamed protein product [Adineta steineri]
MQMNLVPGYVATVFRLLKEPPSNRLLNRLMTRTLSSIERLTESCLTEANKTHSTFLIVRGLLSETIEATTASKGIQTTRLTGVQKEFNLTHGAKRVLEDVGASIAKEYAEVNAVVQKYRRDRDAAFAQIPTGWKAIGQALARTIERTFSAFLNQLGGFRERDSTPFSSHHGNKKLNAQENLYLGQSLGVGSQLSSWLNEFRKNNGSNYEQQKKQLLEECRTARNLLKNGKSSKIKEKLLSLIDRTTGLLEKAKNKKGSPSKGELNQLANELASFKAAEASYSRKTSTTPSSTSHSSTTLNPSEDYSQNEKFKYMAAEQHLQLELKRYDALFAIRLEHAREIATIQQKLASLDMTRINYQELIELMQSALKILAHLQSAWSELVIFFSDINSRTKTRLKAAAQDFVETARSKDDVETANDHQFVLDDIKIESIKIQCESRILALMTRTYVDVSKKYLLQRLASLSIMLTADNDMTRTQLLAKLTTDTEQSRASIRALATERKQLYHEKNAQKRREVKDKIQQFGGANEDDTETFYKGQELLGDKK